MARQLQLNLPVLSRVSRTWRLALDSTRILNSLRTLASTRRGDVRRWVPVHSVKAVIVRRGSLSYGESGLDTHSRTGGGGRDCNRDHVAHICFTK